MCRTATGRWRPHEQTALIREIQEDLARYTAAGKLTTAPGLVDLLATSSRIVRICCRTSCAATCPGAS